MLQILLLRADICHICIGDIFLGRHLAVNCHEGSPQIYLPHRGHHCVDVDGTSHFILAYLHDRGHGGPCQKAWQCQSSGDVGSCCWGGHLPSMTWHFPKARWCVFSWAPEVSGSGSSTTHHALPRGALGWGWAGVTLVTAQLFFNLVALSSSSARAVTMAVPP